MAPWGSPASYKTALGSHKKSKMGQREVAPSMGHRFPKAVAPCHGEAESERAKQHNISLT